MAGAKVTAKGQNLDRGAHFAVFSGPGNPYGEFFLGASVRECQLVELRAFVFAIYRAFTDGSHRNFGLSGESAGGKLQGNVPSLDDSA